MPLDRRSFLRNSSSCAAWILGLAAAAPLATRRAFAQDGERKTVAKEKWARLEQVTDNVWALISTPFESRDFTTVSNGGIIAGKERVLVVEAMNQARGATWLAERAQELTGRWPTDVVVTHYHADHSSGSSGFEKSGQPTTLWLTADTQKRMEQTNRSRSEPLPMLKTVKTIDADQPTKLDLGERQVTVATLSGHTNSDVTIEVQDPNVIFCGDLFFNRLIPNYLDAKPATLHQSVAKLRREAKTLYIPGHGSAASPQDLKLYQEFLVMMEDAARAAFKKGDESQAAGGAFQLPEKFANWYIFSPQVVPRAFAAWYREFETQK